VRGVEKKQFLPKDRVLSGGELAKFGAVLRDKATTYPAAATVARLLALTGLRYAEAPGLRWAEVDHAAGVLRLEESQTGRSVRPCGKSAQRLLESLPRNETSWIFPDSFGTGPAHSRTLIADLFNAAGLADARSHDLRRTFGSTAADLGYSDGTIGDLLGHARRGVTSRHYIRRADPMLSAAADKVSETIARLLDGESGEVVSLQAREGFR
jgi:integrase